MNYIIILSIGTILTLIGVSILVIGEEGYWIKEYSLSFDRKIHKIAHLTLAIGVICMLVGFVF